MGDRPILYMRVKKASAVNMIGAQMNSYSSRKEMMLNGYLLVKLMFKCTTATCRKLPGEDLYEDIPFPWISPGLEPVPPQE